METNELIKRYVYDVTRRLPAKLREDTGNEITGLIEDMLTERCGETLPQKKDVAVVLTELGTPAQLASKYDPNGEKSLIGPTYFSTYLRVLKIVLICTFLGVVAASFISVLVGDATGNIWKIAAGSVGTILNSLFSSFAIVTIVFAVFEWKKINIFSDEDILKLPPVPDKKERVSSTECIIAIVFSVVFAIILLFFPEAVIIGWHFSKNGTEFFHLFNENSFKGIWLFVAVFFLVEILKKSYMLFAGRYSKGVAVVSTVCNIITLIVTPIIVFHPGAFNNVADFVLKYVDKTAADPGIMLLSHLDLVIFAGIYIGTIIDTIECWVRTVKYSKKATANT